MTSDARHRNGSSERRGTTANAGTAGSSEMLRTAATLRWRSPRLTADLANQVVEDAATAGDEQLWLQAAGWYLHGRAATGDAREPAVEILRALGSWPGAAELDGPGAARLRMELAAIAQGNGELDEARALVGDKERSATGDTPDEFRLDRLAVLVRCGLAAPGPGLADLQRSVERVGRRLRAEPAAFADLLVGSVQRSGGDQGAAAASALRGLAHLGWTPALPEVEPTSPHLAAALCTQWVTALLVGGSAREVSDAIDAVGGQQEQADSGRQGVLLRLTLARARPDTPARTTAALRDLADRAGSAGTPALEAACRATQAEVHEGVGDYQEALTALRACIVAERVDRDSGQRFREALARIGAESGASGAGADRDSRNGQTMAGGAPYEQTGIVATRSSRTGSGDEDGQVDTAEAPGSSVVSGNGTSPSVEADPPGGHLLEWVERSWYGPGLLGRPAAAGDSDAALADTPLADAPLADAPLADAPLADALVAELRAAVSSRATGGSVSGPAGDGAFGATDTEAAGGALVADQEIITPAAGAVRREPWAALLPRTRAVSPELEHGGPTNGHDGPGGAWTATGIAVPDPDGSAAGPGAVEHDAPIAPFDGPVADVGHHLVVLDLVLDGTALRHPAAPVVLREVADRAGRLVPPRGEIRPLQEDHGAAVGNARPGRVEVVLPDADRVTALLWAQSLVGHVAGRVGRHGLPHGVVLRSRVHGEGGPVADGVLRALTGPDLAPGPAPWSRPGEDAERASGGDGVHTRSAAAVRADRSDEGLHSGTAVSDGAGAAATPVVASDIAGGDPGDASAGAAASGSGADVTAAAYPAAAELGPGRGRHEARVSWVAGATVRPGTGGRRRRAPDGRSAPDGRRDADPLGGQDPVAGPLGGPDSAIGQPAEAELTADPAGPVPDEDRARRVARDSARRRRRTAHGADQPSAGHTSARSGDPTVIPEDLGLGALLAGALAAYRDI